jgi:hypothetical protein
MATRDQILNDALALPLEDRAFVAEQLEGSLVNGEFASPEIAAAWTAEIERRIAAYDRGELLAADADTSVARMRAYLTEHRARKSKS